MPGLSSHDYSSFIQEAKNTRTNQTSRDRCENLFPSVLLKTGQAMMCRQSLRANMILSGAAGCSWALGVTAGLGQHSPGRVRAGQLQSHKAKPRELPAHWHHMHLAKFSLLALSDLPLNPKDWKISYCKCQREVCYQPRRDTELDKHKQNTSSSLMPDEKNTLKTTAASSSILHCCA